MTSRLNRTTKSLSYYMRVQDVVLSFIKDHPGVTLPGIFRSLGIDPHDICHVVLGLEEKALIVSHVDQPEYGIIRTTYYPA